MLYERVISLRTQNIMESATSASESIFNSTSTIKWLHEEVNKLKEIKAKLITSKNVLVGDCDAQRQWAYQLEFELTNLKSYFTALEKWCQVAESTREAKKWELGELASKIPSLEVALEENEKDFQATLVEWVGVEHLLELVMDDLSFESFVCQGTIWDVYAHYSFGVSFSPMDGDSDAGGNSEPCV